MHPFQSISPISTTLVNTDQIATSANVNFPQAVQVANVEEQPSTSQASYPQLAASTQCLEKFQFNVEREAVDDDFWDNFKEKLEKKSFNELFNDFLLTNWKPKETYKCRFKQVQESITKSIKIKHRPEDIVLHYDALVEAFFCMSLKYNAMNLIHAIMDLSNVNSQLHVHDPQLMSKAGVMKKQDRKIAHINSQYQLIFDKVYLPYQMYLKKTDSQKTATDVVALENALYYLKSSTVKYKKINDVQLVKKHLPFINECLLNLRLHQKIPDHMSIHPLTKAIRVAPVPAQEEESMQPSTKLSELISASSSEIAPLCMPQANRSETGEMKFTCLLNKMMEKDTYIYYEINIDDDLQNENIVVSPEKYHHSMIMLSALHARILLVETKILTVKLMQAKNRRNRITIQRKLREDFSIFIANHLAYEKNIANLQEETINQDFIGMSASDMKDSYFHNCDSIKTARILLDNVLKEYNDAIRHYDESVLVKNYLDFISSSEIIDKMKNTYSLSYKKTNQIIESILNISRASNLTQKQLSSLKFQINRPHADSSLWQAFGNENLPEHEFKRCYLQFLLTSWKSSSSEICELDKKIKRAIRKHLDLQLRGYLVEKHFREKLKYQAFHFIHHILQVIKKYQMSKYLPKQVEMRRTKRDIEESLHKIKENYQKTLATHSDYLAAKGSLEKVDIENLRKEIKTCQSYIRYNRIADTEDTEKYIVLLNEIIENLEKNESFSYSAVINPIKNYMDNDKFYAVSPSIFASKQLQFEPTLSTPVQHQLSVSSTQTQLPDNEVDYVFVPLENEVQHQSYLHSENANISSASCLANLEMQESALCDVAEMKFSRLLDKMMGKDDYFYCEIDINDQDVIVTPEKYYDSMVMLSALNTRILLLKIKTLIIELIQTEDKTNKYNIRRKLREKFSNFMDNHLIYERNTELLQDKKIINRLPMSMPTNHIKYCYFSNVRCIKNANYLLTMAQKKYKSLEPYDENIWMSHYFEFICSSSVMNKVNNSYSLPHDRINKIIKSALNIPSISNLTQEQLSVLKFKINRPHVENSFWQALKNKNLSESEFRQYYFHFILTSWRSSPNEIRELDKAIKEATDNHLDLQLRVNLVEKYFQEKLRYHAFHLIRHILQIMKKYQKNLSLEDKDRAEKWKIEHEKKTSYSIIRENHQNALKTYLYYLTAREAPENVDTKNLFSEIKSCQNYIHHNIKTDTEETERHILFINAILSNIEENKSFSYATIVDLIENYLNGDENIFAVPVASKSHALDTSQFVPVFIVNTSDIQNVTILQPLLLADTLKSEPVSTEFSLSTHLEPFLSSEIPSKQPMPLFDVSHSTINFSSPLSVSQQTSYATKINAQNCEQTLRSTPESVGSSPAKKVKLDSFLCAEMLNIQPVSVFDVSQGTINFSSPLSISQQEFGVSTDSAENYEQTLKPSTELEQEQIPEQQARYSQGKNIDPLDFFNW